MVVSKILGYVEEYMLYFILRMILECCTFSTLTADISLRVLDERLSLFRALTSFVGSEAIEAQSKQGRVGKQDR